MRENTKRGFHGRSFTTFVLLFATLVIATSGLILYVTPRGRVANWTGWSLLGLGKEQWSSVHINAALLFLVVAGFHLFFNWKVLFNYIRSRQEREAGFRRKIEFAGALGVAILFVGGTLGDWPPFSTVVGLNEEIKNYWEMHSPAGPVAHAEELPLIECANQINVPLDQVMARLAAHDLQGAGPQAMLADIARKNGVTPNDIHRWMQPTTRDMRCNQAVGERPARAGDRPEAGSMRGKPARNLNRKSMVNQE